MTRLQTLLGIALTGALLTTGLTASAQPTKPGFATVVRVKGIASYSLGDDRSYPIVAGKFLPPGAVTAFGHYYPCYWARPYQLNAASTNSF